MFKTPALTRGRVQKFLEKVVRPAVYGPTAALEIEMYQCPDPIPYEQAVRQKFRPATVGVRIGPKWSTAWFHLQGKIPAEMAGQKVVLRFRSETEALVYRNGVPDQGMEKNHDDYGLAHPAKGGEAVDLFLECGVNTFFGAGGGSREDSRVPINSLDQPGAEGLFGHLHRCDIAVLYPEVRALAWDLEFLHNLEGKLPEKSPRKRQILWALNDALNALDADDIPGTAAAARAILEPVIQTPAGGSAAACYGASLLCYVTPAEHLGLPDEDEVHQGMIAYRIAAHAGDVARGLPGARARDDEMSRARAAFDWKKQFALALDGPHAEARWRKTRACRSTSATDDHCSMCGPEFCAMRTTQRIRDGK